MNDTDIEALQAALVGPGGVDGANARVDRVARQIIHRVAAAAATTATLEVREHLKKNSPITLKALRNTELAATRSQHGNLVAVASWEDCA